jgi:hypothetical protein
LGHLNGPTKIYAAIPSQLKKVAALKRKKVTAPQKKVAATRTMPDFLSQ